MTPEDKSRRAQAYMQMSTQCSGWKHLKEFLDGRIAKAEKVVLGKEWQMSDMQDTAKRQLAQTHAWTFKFVLKHVDDSIKEEMDKLAKANQGGGDE